LRFDTLPLSPVSDKKVYRSVLSDRQFAGCGHISPLPLDHIALNVNLDMVARQDGGAIWVAGTAHTPAWWPSPHG
jgi:hypothetical protein